MATTNDVTPISQETPRETHPFCTVILPVFNERENLEPLLDHISRALNRYTETQLEIIAVDDASTDGSREALTELRERHSNLTVVSHRINFGQSAAIASGLKVARGEIVVTLDADLQNNPDDLPRLIAALTNDVDAVIGVREQRQDDWVKRVSSKLANGFRNRVTGDSVQDSGCAMRVIRRSAMTETPVFNGMHRFLPSLLRFQGYRVLEIPVSHHPRIWGESKYGIGNRFWRGLIDCFAMRWWKSRVLPGSRTGSESRS